VRRFATVRVRITLVAVVVVAVALAGGALWLVAAQRHALNDNIDTTARLRARDIAATVSEGDFPDVLAVPRGDENLVQVVDANGVVVASSENLRGAPRFSNLVPGESGTAGKDMSLTVGDGPFRVISRRVSAPSGTYTVYVAASLEGVEESTNSLTGLLWFGLPMLVLLVGAMTWILTGRALRPVELIRTEVEEIGAQDLHRRVPEPPTADEIGRLAQTMNDMLARIEESTDRQRRFVEDASHELRSPLTGIRAQLEVDLAHPGRADWEVTEREVLADTVRLQRLVDDLLLLAAVDARSGARDPAPVDLDEVVLAEARRCRSVSSVTIDTTCVSGAQVLGLADQLVRAVRNLLDNALRHARSRVSVSLSEDDNTVTLVVADDGPGIPAEQRDYVFERFARVDGARTSDDGGTGLGLAITRDVIVAHGGSIAIADRSPAGSSAEGGATLIVTFPVCT
jgi:signal transduction histidine kinase